MSPTKRRKLHDATSEAAEAGREVAEAGLARRPTTDLVIDSVARLMQVIPRAPIVPYEGVADHFKVELEGWEEAESPFCPMVDFSEESNVEPPCVFRGFFHTLRILKLGDREQNIYEFMVPDGKGDHERVGIWGSTVLNDRMFRSNPSPGDDMIVVYVGDNPAKPGQNPARIFKVFKRPVVKEVTS